MPQIRERKSQACSLCIVMISQVSGAGEGLPPIVGCEAFGTVLKMSQFMEIAYAVL